MWPPSLLAAKTTRGSRAAGARDEIINSLLRRRFWRLGSRGSRGVVYTAYLTSFQKEGMNNINFFPRLHSQSKQSNIFILVSTNDCFFLVSQSAKCCIHLREFTVPYFYIRHSSTGIDSAPGQNVMPLLITRANQLIA